jgi:hypothetical protein
LTGRVDHEANHPRRSHSRGAAGRSQGYARELSDEVYGIYNFNWGYYLNSLKLFCEKGAGVPFRPPS